MDRNDQHWRVQMQDSRDPFANDYPADHDTGGTPHAELQREVDYADAAERRVHMTYPPAAVPASLAAKYVAASRKPGNTATLASGYCISATPAPFDTGRVHGPELPTLSFRLGGGRVSVRASSAPITEHTAHSARAAAEGRDMTSDEQRADRWERLRAATDHIGRGTLPPKREHCRAVVTPILRAAVERHMWEA